MKSVAQKLGFKPGMTVRVEQAPPSIELALPPSTDGPADLVLVFVPDAAAVRRAATTIVDYRDGDRLWLAYPKKSGPLSTDIDRDRGWDPLTERGFLGVAQIAIDDTWSALRFRRRHEIPELTRTF